MKKALQRYLDKKLDRERPVITDADVDDKRATILRRIGTMSKADLLSWMDQCLYEIGYWLGQYRKDPNEVYLDEVKFAFKVAEEVVREIESR